MNNAFLNALPIIANALGDSLGVEVVLGAGNPRTDGKRIFLPTLDASNAESRMLGIGYIAHESAHVRFSDFDMLKQCKSGLEKHIWNILEDIRIEKKISQVYPGCKLFLAEMAEGLVKTGFFSPLTGEESPTQIMQQYMLHQLRFDILEQQGIAGLAEQAHQLLVDKVPAGMRVRLEALMYEVEECQSTQEVLVLTRAIITMMEEEAKKEEEKENQAKQDQQDSTDQNQSQDGDDSQPQQQDDDDSQQQGGSDSQQGDEDDSSDPSNGQGDSSGTEQDDASDSGSSGGADDKSASQTIKDMLAAGDDEAIKDTGDALKQALGQQEVNESVASATLPFKNVLRNTSANDASVDINAESSRVSAASNALRVRAQSLLQAQTMSRKSSVLMGTKLNVKNLHQAKLGGAVFQKEKKGVAIDTAILVLVDRSGSMSSQINIATDAALATTLAFQRHDVKTAVLAFPYSTSNGVESNAVLKRWDAQPQAAVAAYYGLGVQGSTPMAQAMMGAGMELMNRKEKRKILLVTTDGDPDDSGQAKWVIDLLRKSGVEVLGLGIQSDTTRVFGKNWASVIQDIDALPTAMIGMLDNVMLKKAA